MAQIATPTPTPTYAPLIEPPGRAIECRHGYSIERVDPKTYQAPDGSSHVVRTELLARHILIPFHFNNGAWCVEARFVTESTPGASNSSWQGQVYMTESSIGADDVFDLVQLDFSGFQALFTAAPANRSDPPDRSIAHTCTSPCRGGTLQTEHMTVWPRYLKLPTIYVYGSHTLPGGDLPTIIETKVLWEVPSKMGDSPGAHFGGMLGELREDLEEDVADRVMEWISSLFGG